MTRVGQVLAAYGLDGAVKVLSLTDFDDRFEAGSRLVLEGDEHVVEWSRNAGGDLVVKLKGIDNRTMAQLFRGRFYHHQLVGLAVSTASGRPLGVIAEVLERPANDVWVSREGSLEHLIPATRDAVVEVDLGAGRVVVADWLVQVEEA